MRSAKKSHPAVIQNSRAETTIIKANYSLDQFVPVVENRPIGDIIPLEVPVPRHGNVTSGGCKRGFGHLLIILRLSE